LNDLRDIKLISHKVFEKGGRQCNPFDFFTVQFRTYIREGTKLRKIMDSRVSNEGKPTSFQQGQYHVFKCWDLTLAYLRAGEKVRIYCPSYLANGGAQAVSQLGRTIVYPNTPLIFNI